VVRSATVARQLATSALGLVINMSAHVCGRCGHHEPLFDSCDPAALAQETGLEVWAEIPFDRRLAKATDGGSPLVLQDTDSPAARGIRALAERLAREPAP
jgi:ATP-binding protein involved in chromosome partitioning